jgi:putative lipoprotein
MHFVFAFAFALPGGPPARPAPSKDDPWFGRDKLLHFTASALIQSGTHIVLRSMGDDYGRASRGAALITLTAGVGKELYDRHAGRDFSLRDLTWDGIGGVTAAVAMRQLDTK